MKIVCTKAELVAMTRSCQSIRCEFSCDDGCRGCVLFNFCDDGNDLVSAIASDTFDEACDIEVVIDG